MSLFSMLNLRMQVNGKNNLYVQAGAGITLKGRFASSSVTGESWRHRYLPAFLNMAAQLQLTECQHWTD
ncbi:hypothetical protein, partial [Erwinia amylovora]|uniref:hypothetical protein n=1 Tax=Erwinia amylovora TaxID=552 RepID=UPI001C55824B